MRRNDIILFLVVFGSMGLALYEPRLGEPFQPYLIHCMMLLLFLSFTGIDFKALLDTSAAGTTRLVMLTVLKLAILPALLYGVALVVMPDYALPILLLTGVSTGVVAPFIGGLLQADIARILRMVIVTSLLVPFSLPILVKLLAGEEMHISLAVMMQLLAVVVFVPMGAVALARRFCPGVLTTVARRGFPITLTLFVIVNLGVFSKYSAYFFAHPDKLLFCVVLAYGLSVIYYTVGFLVTPSRPLSERISSGVSLAIMNNVLVIVFSSEFFGPLSPMLAAMYMFPFYTMIVPVKIIAARLAVSEQTGHQ